MPVFASHRAKITILPAGCQDATARRERQRRHRGAVSPQLMAAALPVPSQSSRRAPLAAEGQAVAVGGEGDGPDSARPPRCGGVAAWHERPDGPGAIRGGYRHQASRGGGQADHAPLWRPLRCDFLAGLPIKKTDGVVETEGDGATIGSDGKPSQPHSGTGQHRPRGPASADQSRTCPSTSRVNRVRPSGQKASA